VEILITIFGTGFIGSAILNFYVLNENKKLNKNNRIFSNLQAQLHNLYAPLNFLVCENENTIDLYDKYHKEYLARYENKNWSHDEVTQEAIRIESQKLLEVANHLISKYVVENNEKIISLIRENSSYIENDDIEIFNKFIEHYKRLKTEYNEAGKLIIPYEIYKKVGNVSYMDPDFIGRVKERYSQKRHKIDSYISESGTLNHGRRQS